MVIFSYILALFLGAGWAIGFSSLHPGKEIHILLVLAILTLYRTVGTKDQASKGYIHLPLDQSETCTDA